MTDELDYLTPEQRKSVQEIYPKEITNLEPELKNEPTPTQLEDIKKGYIDYEHKTKQSERIIFGEDEIEITEEDSE